MSIHDHSGTQIHPSRTLTSFSMDWLFRLFFQTNIVYPKRFAGNSRYRPLNSAMLVINVYTEYNMRENGMHMSLKACALNIWEAQIKKNYRQKKEKTQKTGHLYEWWWFVFKRFLSTQAIKLCIFFRLLMTFLPSSLAFDIAWNDFYDMKCYDRNSHSV